MGFASVIINSDGAMVQGKKHCNKGRGKKGALVATASAGVDVKAYMPFKLTLSREAYNKAIVVILEATNAILPLPLYADPMLSLVATLAAFKATLGSDSMVPKDKD